MAFYLPQGYYILFTKTSRGAVGRCIEELQHTSRFTDRLIRTLHMFDWSLVRLWTAVYKNVGKAHCAIRRSETRSARLRLCRRALHRASLGNVQSGGR